MGGVIFFEGRGVAGFGDVLTRGKKLLCLKVITISVGFCIAYKSTFLKY